MNKYLIDSLIEELKKAGTAHLQKLEKSRDFKGEKNFLEFLLKEGIAEEEDLLPALSKVLNIPPIDLKKMDLDANILKVVPEKLIRKHSVLPVSRIGKKIILAMFNPDDIMVTDDVKSATGLGVDPVLASFSQLKSEINRIFSMDEDELVALMNEDEENIEMFPSEDGLDIVEITKESTAAPIVKIVDLIITEAVKCNASDIHIEPQERSLRVRYRVDGSLREAFDLPKNRQNAIIARIKIMSSLDITETRIPQDGRFRIRTLEKDIDFRVSVIPLTTGNKVVLRALDKSNLSIGLGALGFLPGPLKDFRTALKRPYGMILVTGPTGSGKSTTLYSILSKINTPDRNIITVENPVEYQLEGITQIAAKPEIGLDFANGLKAILRQNPDVIMVGEIRDLETADVAIKASLTGHMVFSTLHTNDSVGAITRLENMGIEPFLLSSSLVLSCAQRLLRKICPSCKARAEVSPEVLEKLKEDYPEARDVKFFYTGKGCPACNGTGYQGRVGTLETLLVDDNIRMMINKRSSENDIREYLKEKQVRTLRDNAMIKFINGVTSLEEVYRVT